MSSVNDDNDIGDDIDSMMATMSGGWCWQQWWQHAQWAVMRWQWQQTRQESSESWQWQRGKQYDCDEEVGNDSGNDNWWNSELQQWQWLEYKDVCSSGENCIPKEVTVMQQSDDTDITELQQYKNSVEVEWWWHPDEEEVDRRSRLPN